MVVAAEAEAARACTRQMQSPRSARFGPLIPFQNPTDMASISALPDAEVRASAPAEGEAWQSLQIRKRNAR